MGMRTIAVLWVGASLLLQGCASGGYWSSRWNDAKDVFTLAGGLGLGAKARVGPLQLPLIVQSDYVGLRCGECFASPMRDDYWTYVSEAGRVVECPIPAYFGDYDTLFSGYEVFDPGGFASARNKRIQAQGMGLAAYDATRRNAAFYTQIEATAGVFVSVRVGFNPGELVDALLGFTTLDIFGDDVKGGHGE